VCGADGDISQKVSMSACMSLCTIDKFEARHSVLEPYAIQLFSTEIDLCRAVPGTSASSVSGFAVEGLVDLLCVFIGRHVGLRVLCGQFAFYLCVALVSGTFRHAPFGMGRNSANIKVTLRKKIHVFAGVLAGVLYIT
jgi:hypothetical protein